MKSVMTAILIGLSTLPALAQESSEKQPARPAAKAGARGAGAMNAGRANAVYDILNAVIKEMDLSEEQTAAIRKHIAEHQADVAKFMLKNREELRKLGEEMQVARASGDTEGATKAGEKLRDLMEQGASPRSLFLAIADELDQTQVQKFQSLAQQKRKEYEEKNGPLPEPRNRPGMESEAAAKKPVERIDAKKVIADLNLSPEQMQKVGVIMQEFREQMQRFMQFNGEKLKQTAAKLRDAREKQDPQAAQAAVDELEALRVTAPDDIWAKIEEILTPEQKQKFTGMAEKLREQTRRDMTERLMQGQSPLESSGKR